MAKFMLPFPDKFLTGHFGKIRTFKGAPSNPHRGTDWARPAGTPIPAVSDGTVRLIQYSKILGWVLVHTLRVNNKTYFVGYCHLKDEPTLKVDQKIKCGDTIGLVGNTGSASSGPHLHATLSTSPKGVFAGTVLDLYIFLSDLIKNAPQSKPAPRKSSTTPKKETKPAKPAICPSCGQEVKK